MKRFLCVPLALLYVGACALSLPAVSAGPASGSYVPDEIKLPLSLQWKYSSLGQETPLPRGYNPAAPVIDGNVAYIMGRGVTPDKLPTTTVNAVSLETGEKLWDHLLEYGVYATPVLVNGVLWAVDTKGYLIALDTRQRGKELLRYELGRGSRCAPVVHEGILYVGNDAGHIFAIDVQSDPPREKWRVAAKAAIQIPLTIHPEQPILYVVGNDRVLYALKLNDGSLLWTHPLRSGALGGEAVVWGNNLYVASDTRLLCMHATTGRDRWSFDLRNTGTKRAQQFMGAPTLVPDADGNGARLFFTCDDRTVWALNAVTGNLAWKAPVQLDRNPKNSPTVTDNAVLVGADGGFLYAITADEGKLLWKYRFVPPADIAAQTGTTLGFLAAPIVARGQVYAFADEGTLLCFAEDVTDTAPPEVKDAKPDGKDPIYGRPPVYFSAKIVDEGSGVDQSKIIFKLDGEVKAHKFNPITGELTYATPVTRPILKSLENGRHTASITVSDWMGNTTEHSWVFQVDNRYIPPPPAPNPNLQGGFGGVEGGFMP